MKTTLFTLCLFLSTFLYAQKERSAKMGQTSLKELQMTYYNKDSSASAVILDEKNVVYVNPKKDFNYTNEYYVRIKILNKSAFDYGFIEIPYYKSSKLEKIEGITYNLNSNGEIEKYMLSDQEVYKNNYSKNIKIERFALPNIKVGSVIEYKFMINNNSYKTYNFIFQQSIPSVKSEYTAYLSGSNDYNVRLIGYLSPYFNESIIKKKCIYLSKCVKVNYVFKDIPAFVSEKYITSKYNYISRLTFEKTYYDRFVEKGDNLQWRTLDKWVNKSLENRLNLKSFYKRKLPDSILKETNDLKKAKKVFYYIQNHYISGNNEKKTFGQSYKNKVTSSTRINISLFNALKAVGFKNVYFMMLSTRENGFPTKLHATLDDFNSDLIVILIEKKKYLLDASDKLLSFGQIPFESLNGEGRVFDFKKGSYWETIVPEENNNTRVKMKIFFNDEGFINGNKTITRNGYHAIETKKLIKKYSEQEYIKIIESQNPMIEVENYVLNNKNLKEKPLIEVFDITIEEDENSYFTINSLLSLENINPFKLETRNYPIDYGYKKKYVYTLNFKLLDGYEFDKIPKDLILAIPDKGGSYIQKISLTNNQLNVYIKLQLNKTKFLTTDYQYLKKFYDDIIQAQNQLIHFQKK